VQLQAVQAQAALQMLAPTIMARMAAAARALRQAAQAAAAQVVLAEA